MDKEQTNGRIDEPWKKNGSKMKEGVKKAIGRREVCASNQI